MRWIGINSTDDYQKALQDSFRGPVAIFKHSTRCSTSSVAKGRLERDIDLAKIQIPFFFLNLIQYREVSDRIESDLQIAHESPQLIIVRNGKSIYNASHLSISVKGITELLDNIASEAA